MKILIERIRNRLLVENKNWLAIICGETGSGKSYSALKIAESIDSNFSINNVVFKPKEFIELLNSNNLKKGSVIVWDEAGVGIPARDWYTISNKMINYVLQTFRHLNLGVIFTTPSFDYIDIQARKLFHTYIETVAIDRNENVCIVKWMNLQYNPRFDKLYFKYPVVLLDGKYYILQRIKIGLPSKDLIEAYEEKKKTFTESLNKDIERRLGETERKRRTPVELLRDIAQDIVNNKPELIKREKGEIKLDKEAVCLFYNIGRSYARRVEVLVNSILNRK